jgi:hypothetical protein
MITKRLWILVVVLAAGCGQGTQQQPPPNGARECGSIVEGLNEVAANRISASQCFLDALAACEPATLSHQMTSDEGAPSTEHWSVVVADDSCEVMIEHDNTHDPLAAEPRTRQRCRTASLEQTTGGTPILSPQGCEGS